MSDLTRSLPDHNRPLFIDFDLYTDGDVTFKKKLILSMIENIRELQQSLSDSGRLSNFGLFRSTRHKIKATLMILNDVTLMQIIDGLMSPSSNEEQKRRQADLCNQTCDEIIKSLLIEECR